MSRVGKRPIPLPDGVTVQVEGNNVKVNGPKGNLDRTVPRDLDLQVGEGTLVVKRPSDSKEHRSLHGLTRTLVSNMVEGVTNGFQKGLELSGVGYRAALQGRNLILTVGYSHPVIIEPPQGIEIEVPAPNRVTVRGIDKERVGAVAADIRRVRTPNPYSGKGIRYENEVIRRKVGKTGK